MVQIVSVLSVCISVIRFRPAYFYVYLICLFFTAMFRTDSVQVIPHYLCSLVRTLILAKSLECSYFRGIAIRNIISQCFEYCLLSTFSGHFNTSDNQPGFNSAQGCGHAIYAAPKIINTYVEGWRHSTPLRAGYM
jgi:hypothetical protein